MYNKQISKRCLSLFLALVMLVGMFPVNLFAQGNEGTCTADPNKVSSSSIVKDQDKKEDSPTKDDNGVILDGFDEHGQEYKAAGISSAPNPNWFVNNRGVHGRAYDMTGNDFNTADNNNPLPNGTVIYFQWMDSDGVKSPIFTAKTFTVGTGPKDGGWYSYDPTKLDFKDGNGKVHKLAYQTVRQYYRFWLAPGQKSPNGNTWTTARQAPGGQVGFYRATQNSAGTFMLAGFNYQKTAVFVYEQPNIDLMTNKKNYKKDTAGPLDKPILGRPANTVSGSVWWETSEGNMAFPQSTGEPFVQQTLEQGKTGIRVITSALTKQGIAAISKFDKFPMNTRIKSVAETLKAHPEYIQQTVEAPVVSINGIAKYAARFDDPIDVNYLYQYAIDGEGNILNIISGFPVPLFNAGNEFTHTAATANAATKGGVYNLHLALVNDPFKSSIKITNYDTTVDGAASPGDEAKIEVEANYLPGNKVEIVWVDADGKELSVKEVTSKEDAEKQTYKVPNNLTEKTAYSVQLRINGIIIDSDSFIADPSTKIRLHRNSSVDDKYVDIIKVEDPDSQKVELQALRNTDKYQEVQNKYFVGWSTNKDATQPDVNVLIDQSKLDKNSTTDLYVRDGSIYKYRDNNCVPVKDLYAVWKDPMTVKATKKWVNTVAENYDTSKLKFGLLHRAAVGTFGKEVVAGLATYEPVLGKDMVKAYTGQELVWDNLPSYKEEGKRISYLIVELPTKEMVDKYNAGSTDWDSYNINVVEVKEPTYSYHKKEQTLSMTNTTTNKVDAITSSTKRLHIINGQAVDPHARGAVKPGYFDTQGYVITVTNKKQTLTPPSIEPAKSGDKELIINLKSGEEINGLKGTFTSSKTKTTAEVVTDFIIKKDSSTNTWTITKSDGSAFNGVTVDTTKSTADKVVLKLDDAHALKADDKLVARTYKTVDGNDVVSSDDTMTVKDNNSRLPKNIKQAYSDKNDKVVITATPFQQDVNGQMITVVPSTTTYKLVDADGNQIAGTPIVTANNNEIKFEIDKDKVSEDTEYFIQAQEPGRAAKDTREVEGVASEKGVASDKSVKLDLTAPQGTIPDIKGFVGKKIEDKTFDITEASGKINVIERQGPNGLKSAINGTQGTISGTPTVPYNGQTKLIVEDMFGNKGTLTGKADIYAKVVDTVPDGEGSNYYSVTFKSDNNSWLLKNGIKISEITKYIIKDFNGDGSVNESDKITLAQAEDEGLMIPEYEVREGYKVKTPNWEPNFEADVYKFGPNDATFTLQTEQASSIIPVKPGNDGTLPETPKGYVRVTLDKDKTVKFKDNVETIYDVRLADKVRYADVYQKVEAQPVDDSYKNVSWYKGDDKVKGTEIITEIMTLTAKVENDKPIIPVKPGDDGNLPETPKGYVRITIDKGDRIESVTGVTTYDVKSDGSVRYGDIIDYVEAEDKKVDATTNAKNGKTQINIDKDNNTNEPLGKLPYTWKVDNADVVRDAGPGTEAKTLTVSATMLDKDKYDPHGKEQTVNKGSTPDPKNSIENPEKLPEETKYKFVKEDPENSGKFVEDTPDTSTTGEKNVKVQVTYPDGSTDIVDTKIKVVEPKDIIPFVPDKPEDPTNPNDKNVPTEDTDGNPINKDDYVIVAFKIGQPGAATLVLDGKKGEVVSALVKKTNPLKKWSEITLPTIGQTMDQNNQYTFEKWVDAAKAEMTADKLIADKAIYTATFKTNDGFDKDAIIGFNFVKDPTKMEYNEGDKPKHDGLEIELVDKNNNKVTVTKDKLEEYGITIEPKEDTALTKDDDGKHLVAKITTKDGDGADKELTASSPGALKVKEKSSGNTTDADKYTPEGKDITVSVGENPKAEDGIKNKGDLPDGTNYKFKNPVDTNTPGEKSATIVVTYPDNSTEEVTIKVIVNDKTTPTPEKPSVNYPDTDINKGETKTVTPVIKDKDGIPIKPDKTPVVDQPGNGVVVTPHEDGSITVKVPEDYDGPRTIDVPVKVTVGGVVINTNLVIYVNGGGYVPGDHNHNGDWVFPLVPNYSGISFSNVQPYENTLWYIFTIDSYKYQEVRNKVSTNYTMDVTPVIRNNRTMLPLRFVAEAIGADVKWDAKTRTATFTKDGLTASIQVDGNEIVLSNGKVIKMDSKPLMLNNRVLVSVVNVGNVFGLTNGNTLDGIDQDIEWDAQARTATIYIRR